jgi:hypothetical protein
MASDYGRDLTRSGGVVGATKEGGREGRVLQSSVLLVAIRLERILATRLIRTAIVTDIITQTLYLLVVISEIILIFKALNRTRFLINVHKWYH